MPILRDLRVHAFRNLVDQTVALEPGITVFSGANGQGKTNFLEAVFFLGLLRSFRTSRIAHLLQWEHANCAVDGTLVEGDAAPLKIGVRHGAKRQLLRGGQPVARASDYLGGLHCVPIVPEDLQLAKGSARLRRQFMDVTLAPHDAECLHALQRFNQALSQRNALLKSHRVDATVLSAFDQELVASGALVVCRRAQFVRELSIQFQRLLSDLPAPGLAVELHYQPGFTTNIEANLARTSHKFSSRETQTARAERLATEHEDGVLQHSVLGAESEARPIADGCVSQQETGEKCGLEQVSADFRQSLARSADRDHRYGQSHVGPQRDDIRLLLDGRILSDVGSEGQCRLTAILLRLAAAMVLTQEDDPPVVLVDDVIGELDAARRAYFVSLLASFPQVLLACTDAAELPDYEGTNHYVVSAGTVTAR